MAPSRGKKRDVDGQVRVTQNGIHKKLDSHRSGVRDLGSISRHINFDPTEKENHTSNGATKKPSNLRERARQLLTVRQQLPIWEHRAAIQAHIRDHGVLLLVGETGSGKSTQVPQFLVTEKYCRRKTLRDGSKVGGCIAITQPRRVAAISLARRVAEEMGTPLGSASPASEVGYSVRFDKSTSPSTRIKFLTEGMLLQEMLRDPWLKEYSCIIVDEVHERGLNVDLVLAFLRRLQEQICREGDQRGGCPLKIVVMSATADMARIKDFFDGVGSENPNQGIAKVNGHQDEWHGFSDEENDAIATASDTNGNSHQTNATSLHIKGRQYPVQIHYSPQPVPDIIDAALQRIIEIHSKEPLPGDVLVFLTGQETVESLLNLVDQYAKSVGKDSKLSEAVPKLLTLPLYAALPSNLQQRVFQAAPPFTRKIILATNIAETSITVPGVRYVIDCGKSKRRIFRPSLNLDSLLTAPISRSSANQRSGRAGRDGPGHAYRLYTEADYYKLPQDTEPEILHCDLSQLVINLKSHGVDNLKDFPLLTRPPSRALERAVINLLQLQALDGKTGKITPLGRDMSLLPLPGHLARILLASSEPQYDCVDEIVDIVSALSVENVFINIHNDHSLHDNSHVGDSDDDSSPQEPRLRLRQQLHRREGDHLTLLATVQAYVEENSDRKRWCEDRAISHRAMQSIMDVRKQLSALMKKRRQSLTDGTTSTDRNTASDMNTRILKCCLTGLHANVARLSLGVPATADGVSRGPAAQYTTLLTNQAVSIHPSSVLFGRKVEGIMSSEFVYTTKAYARCVSAVELGWLNDARG